MYMYIGRPTHVYHRFPRTILGDARDESLEALEQEALSFAIFAGVQMSKLAMRRKLCFEQLGSSMLNNCFSPGSMILIWRTW